MPLWRSCTQLKLPRRSLPKATVCAGSAMAMPRKTRKRSASDSWAGVPAIVFGMQWAQLSSPQTPRLRTAHETGMRDGGGMLDSADAAGGRSDRDARGCVHTINGAAFARAFFFPPSQSINGQGLTRAWARVARKKTAARENRDGQGSVEENRGHGARPLAFKRHACCKVRPTCTASLRVPPSLRVPFFEFIRYKQFVQTRGGHRRGRQIPKSVRAPLCRPRSNP